MLPPTKLILVRHGATQANVCEPYVLQGLRPDHDLVKQGQDQARAAAQALRMCRAIGLYCSPLKRAVQTAHLIASVLGMPVEVEPALVEADTGLWTELGWEEIEQRWPEEHKAFQEDPERHGYLGGENLAQVRDRLLPTMARLVARHPGETLLVVGHGMVNRVLLAHWLALPLRYARRIPHDNGGVNVVEFRAATAKVRTINSLSHLDDLSFRA